MSPKANEGNLTTAMLWDVTSFRVVNINYVSKDCNALIFEVDRFILLDFKIYNKRHI
jgi:hypothetical protein